MGGEVQTDLETRQHPLPGLEAQVVGAGGVTGIERLIGVAEQGGRVARPPRRLGHVVQAPVQRRAVGHHPVIELVGPGVEAGSARTAGRGLAVVTREPHAVAGQPIEVRRLHDRMAGDGQRVAAELVESDEEDVHSAHNGRSFTTKGRGGYPAR